MFARVFCLGIDSLLIHGRSVVAPLTQVMVHANRSYSSCSKLVKGLKSQSSGITGETDWCICGRVGSSSKASRESQGIKVIQREVKSSEMLRGGGG